MKGRKNITFGMLIFAVMAMMLSVYVPHHHHSETSCIGHTDCRNMAAHHSHHDGCGASDHGQVCCAGNQYIDSKQTDCEDIGPLFNPMWAHSGELVALSEISLTEQGIDFHHPIILLPSRPYLSLKSLRSPPVC